MKRTLMILVMLLLCVTSNAQRKYVETIYGYLKVFPEELGTFESIPSTIISNLNARNIYSYNSWRVPTNEELQLIKSKGYLKTGVTYMTKENPKGVCLLVTDKEIVTFTINGHEYVDLGLSVKWATCNVGASNPEDYGNYYAWGETSTKETYDEDNCPTYGLSISQLQSQGYIDSEGNLTSQYDAARANWGGTWRLPTEAELEELNNKCTWKWTTQNGVNGYKVTGPNGNSIFLPAAGGRIGSSLYDAGEGGFYWSSTPHESLSNFACSLFFYSSELYVDYIFRHDGLSVRPVSE